MSVEVNVLQSNGEVKIQFSEWVEVPDLLEISAYEWEQDKYTFKFSHAVMDKKEWEEFKRAGDFVFSQMEGAK